MKDLLYYYPAVITCDKGAFGGHLFETFNYKAFSPSFVLADCYINTNRIKYN